MEYWTDAGFRMMGPGSLIPCDYQGMHFRQYLPSNITVEIVRESKHEDSVTHKMNFKNNSIEQSKIISKLLDDRSLPIKAKEILKNNPCFSPDVVAQLLSAIVQSTAYAYFPDLLRLVSICEKDLCRNPNAMLQAAFAAWSQGLTDECERWSKNVITMAPNHPAGYLRLGLNCLTTQKFVEAFLALSAGMRNANNDQSLIGWFHLAQRMVTGPREVLFEKFGKQFRYRLSCFNTQAVETDAAHLRGVFTEESELEFLAGTLVGCKSFVEVGALVGNHTIFLASFFKPEKYLVVDADDRSIAETSANVELNRENYPDTVFSFVESALAGAGGEEVQIGPKKVLTHTLEELLPADVDFLKIDIDGMEGALLDPLLTFLKNKNVRVFIEVEAPFLNEYEIKMRQIGYFVTNRTDHGSYANLFFQKKGLSV